MSQRLLDLEIDPDTVNAIVGRALFEDLGPYEIDGDGQVRPHPEDAGCGDPTSEAIFPLDEFGRADLVAREAGVIAGLPVAGHVFGELSGRARFTEHVAEGAEVAPGDRLATVTGPTRKMLEAERTALNLLSRMSGVATHTRKWVRALEGSRVKVLDTRKTTPGLRVLDKYAVRAGGGQNKRMGLYDVAMIKDNHKFAAGSITAAYDAVRRARPDIDIQVEVDTLDEAREAVNAGASFLLCDNMTPDELREVAAAVGEHAALEATGRITLDTAAAYAASGVDYISSGALTHSSPILDIALDWHRGDGN